MLKGVNRYRLEQIFPNDHEQPRPSCAREYQEQHVISLAFLRQQYQDETIV